MELKNLKINFLGDSITEGSGADADKIFCALLEKNYGAICRNYGIGGTRIARQTVLATDYTQRDYDFIQRVEKMDKDADLVAIFGGTNDYGHGDSAMGNFDDRSVYTFYGALHTLYTDIITAFPKSTIIVFTPLHRDNEEKIVREGGAHLLDYVNAIREVAQYYSLPVLDLFSVSGLQPSIPVMKQMYMPDGLHPNNAGHAILTKKIASFIKAL